MIGRGLKQCKVDNKVQVHGKGARLIRTSREYEI